MTSGCSLTMAMAALASLALASGVATRPPARSTRPTRKPRKGSASSTARRSASGILAGQLGRVLAPRQPRHLDRDVELPLPLVEALGRPLPGGVGVEGQDDPAGEALEEPDVVRGEGGAARRDGDGHAGLVEADHVRVALADDDPVGLDDVALGPAQPVQHPGLAVDLGLRRVLVLGRVRAARQDPPAEGDRLAGLVEDREQQAGPEGVLQPVAPVEEGQTALPQRPLRPGQAGGERVPVVGRPAEPEPAGDGPVDAPAAQVVPRRPARRAR